MDVGSSSAGGWVVIDPVSHWLDGLERRYLADLTPAEVARALRALSSCYVERRGKLRSGGALDSRGKRAAFALFYGPLHFLVARRVVEALVPADLPVARIVDAGCGTGVAGAAWARHAGVPVTGSDKHPWAVTEARRTYQDLGIAGMAVHADITRALARLDRHSAVILGYVVNELDNEVRALVLSRVMAAASAGARVLVLEPIARRVSPWWPEWEAAFTAAGGRADEWRFVESLPPRQRDLARAAGLDPRELTARTLWR